MPSARTVADPNSAVLVAARKSGSRSPRWRTAALLVGLPLLSTWSLASGFYVLFHDRVLASLMARQAEMQYDYEDRLADMRAALEGATGRAQSDRESLNTTVQDLAARSARLEARSADLDALVSSLVGTRRPPPPRSSGGMPGPADLRLEHKADLDGRAGLSLERVASSLARAEATQRDDMRALRSLATQAADRTRATLAELGIASARAVARDVGGPFVPLTLDPAPDEAASGDVELALLKDALARQRRFEELADRLPLREPIAGPFDVSSSFGARMDPFYGRPAMHTGIDLRDGYGAAVRATGSGTVTGAGADGGYGTMVEIDHGNGFSTRYAHLSGVSVSVGRIVAVGDVIGRVGSSGRATGPHLHYEVRRNGEAVDPARYLALAAQRLDVRGAVSPAGPPD